MSSVGVHEFSLEKAMTSSWALFGSALSLSIWGARKVFIAYFPSLEGSQLFEQVWPGKFSGIESAIWGGIFGVGYQFCRTNFKQRHVFEWFVFSAIIASIPFAPFQGISDGLENAKPVVYSFAAMALFYLAIEHFKRILISNNII